MFENLISLQEFEKVINVPFAVIIASFIIIIITTNMTDTNGLSSLLGGYSGLMLGMLFVMVLNMLFTNTSYLDMTPIIMILIIVGLLIFYLSTYFERISKGEVSGYYGSFSLLSTIFLMTQVIIIFTALYDKAKNPNNVLFSPTTFSLLLLFGVINCLIVLTIGIVLRFYSTQG
jgi:hypothetical protein